MQELRYSNDDTSKEAAESMKVPACKQRAQIMDHLHKVGHATCDELEVALNMKHQSCSARVLELREDGLLYWTGSKRRTRSGRNARVYRPVGVLCKS